MFPAHHDLEQVMQAGKQNLIRDQNSSPDRWIDVSKANIQLVYLFN